VTIVESTTFDTPPFDVARIRADFPILSRRLAGDLPLAYLDSANTSQKPESVIRAIDDHYRLHNANVARAMHQLGAEASTAFELGRDKVAAFIGAPNRDEVVFTKNASEALNLVARAVGDSGRIGQDHEIVITEMEHHANLVPWQELRDKTGVILRWIGLTDDGRLDLADLDELVNERTRLLSFVHQSNILGTINPVPVLAARAREVGALILLDACQSVPHMPVDVTELGVDFIAWSGHKMLGPTGIGCLWGRADVLSAMPPFISGGSMIHTVTMERSTFADPPQRFEAGVPMISQAVGLHAAVDYLQALGMDAVQEHETELTAQALAGLESLPGLRIIGPRDTLDRGGAVSFVVDGIHPHDLGQVLDDDGVAVRVGHHCAWPTCRRYGVPATTRATFHIYNDKSDVDALVEGVVRAQRFFGVV